METVLYLTLLSLLVVCVVLGATWLGFIAAAGWRRLVERHRMRKALREFSWWRQ